MGARRRGDHAPGDLALVRKIVDRNEGHLVPAPACRHGQVGGRVGWAKAFRAVDDKENAHGRRVAHAVGGATQPQIGPANANAQHLELRLFVNA